MVSPDSEFVIQQHTTAAGIHWDLMLQRGSMLWTWRMTFSPEHIDNAVISIERIFDHPLRFLSYEGPVQNGTGNVKIADKGVFRLISEHPDAICIDLQGKLVRGCFLLTHQAGSLWQFVRQIRNP